MSRVPVAKILSGLLTLMLAGQGVTYAQEQSRESAALDRGGCSSAWSLRSRSPA